METKDDVSYGVIPVLRDTQGWRVFLINQYGSAGDVYWTFPKGHPEEGESPQETAVRELHEETGMEPAELLADHIYTQEYSYVYGDLLIRKQVQYYLGIVQDADFSIQEDEVREAGWFTPEEAQRKLSFAHARDMFAHVCTDLQARADKL